MSRKIHWTEPGYSTPRVKAWKIANPEKAKDYLDAYLRRTVAKRRRKAKARYKSNRHAIIKRVGKYRVANYDKTRNANYKRLYGITLAQYNAMLEAQGGVCALCKRPPGVKRLSVDHCHRDKRVRGLACFRCNKFLIGRWKREHAPLLRLAADYLESSFDGRTIGGSVGKT